MTVGDVLVRRGLVGQHQLAEAEREARETGVSLVDVLVASGRVEREAVFRALAEASGLPFLDLAAEDVDDALCRAQDVTRMVAGGWFPVRREADGTVLVAVSSVADGRLRAEVAEAVGAPVAFAVATDRDVTRAVRERMRDELLHVATEGLWERDEEASAREVLTAPQKVLAVVVLVVLAALALVWPGGVVAGLSLVVAFGFSVSVAFKFAVCMAGARREWLPPVRAVDLRDDELPLYTVLVPCYREENVIGRLVENLGVLDYPASKLEVLLLLEADDSSTLQAAVASRPPPYVSIVVVPDGQPRTKPKACNVGLQLARGEFVVIYDAEDKPDPDQLRKAVAAFRASGPKTVCVQAALNYWNAEENVLTRMFTLEYSFWFDYMLAGLDWRSLPIPLGGTSNHFRVDALRRLGAWDPFNVTEDADLGIRAAARGMRVGIIDSTTFEEANRAAGNWVRQRSRWIKGYIQTLLVHLRHPVRLVRTTGWKQAAGFALLIGGTPLSFLCVPPLYALLVLSVVVDPAVLAPLFPGWVLWTSLANLLVGNALMVWVSMMGAFRRQRYRLVPWALLNPLYWLLHSIAAYKAVGQLVTKPHYWEKTEHGLSRVEAGASPAPA
ncbi:glycosyltransferase [Actinosynnema sp. NPDC053489]|uniref:glycosyltransferase n=1 Tax=Actinosynnema sp. NPDC053489 TaxID=3363916 RepID=UPI0037C5E7B8